MTIIWTKHAIERVGERFGFDSSIQIPNEMIGILGETATEGKAFNLGCGDVVYVCVRHGNVVKIVTVKRKNNDNPRSIQNPPRPPGMAKGSKRRSGRSGEAIGSDRSDFNVRGNGDW